MGLAVDLQGSYPQLRRHLGSHVASLSLSFPNTGHRVLQHFCVGSPTTTLPYIVWIGEGNTLLVVLANTGQSTCQAVRQSPTARVCCMWCCRVHASAAGPPTTPMTCGSSCLDLPWSWQTATVTHWICLKVSYQLPWYQRPTAMVPVVPVGKSPLQSDFVPPEQPEHDCQCF